MQALSAAMIDLYGVGRWTPEVAVVDGAGREDLADSRHLEQWVEASAAAYGADDMDTNSARMVEDIAASSGPWVADNMADTHEMAACGQAS